ncbi:MAG: MFS transporter [Bilophila wadsworthia]
MPATLGMMSRTSMIRLKLADVPSVRTYLTTYAKACPGRSPSLSDAGGPPLRREPEDALQAGVPVRRQPGFRDRGIDESTVWEAFRSIVYDTLTIMIIAMLFMLELVPLQGVGQAAAPSAGDPLPPRIMRPIIFLCMFAIDLPASFIPLRIAEMDLGLLGLPPDVVMGLPLSFEMCAVGIGILIGSFWSQKRGWRPLLLWGALLVALGNVASGLVSDSLAYILSRGGAGFGYGLINLAGQVFVVSHSSPEHRAGNLSALVAGLYAGFLCGSAFGGLIADNLGYASAFLVSAGLMAIIGIFLHFALPREAWTPEPSASGRISLRGLGAFFSDIKMAGLLLGNIFPCAFVTVCLFQFFLPVSLSQAGVSPAGIGRVFLLFCLVIIYLGPSSRAVDKSPNKLVWLVGGGFLCIGGIIALLLLDGLAAAFACVALLALCNAIVASAQGTYALEIPVSRQVGSGRTVGIYNITERLGQMLGPVALGQVIALWGVNSGLLGMAAVLAVLNILFALTGRLAKAGA